MWGVSVRVSQVESMAYLIEHRGPDQTGQFNQALHSDCYRVITKRLSIQDLSAAGNQPMSYENYVLAFNGEIYNHWELRQELGSRVSWKSASDTETVLKAFTCWGIEETLSRLNGVYSIALWNRSEQSLLLARDPMGVKPLYYSQSALGVFFSSELKAMTVGESKKVSIRALAFYLLFGYVPSPWSMIDGVYKVQPGERLVFKDKMTKPDVHRIVPIGWKSSLEISRKHTERVESMREILHASVDRQLLSDAPVGIFLSGGIDSTIIASLMAEHGSYHSFGLGYSDSSDSANSDAILAAKYSQQLGWKHTTVQLNPSDFEGHWETYITALDEPVAEANFIGQILLSQAAASYGIKVVLTGDGSDEIFHGYPSYFAVKKGDVLNAIPWFGTASKIAAYLPFLNYEFKQNLNGASSVWRKSVSDRFWIIGSVLFDVPTVASWLGIPASQLVVWVKELVQSDLRRLSWPPTNEITPSNVELLGRLELGTHVADHYNMRLDKATMSQSVEARVPFQDLDVVNFGLRLPESDKMSKTEGKVILRESFQKELPDYITRRSKQTFQAPLRGWINGALGPLRSRLFESSGSTPWAGWQERSATTAQGAHQLWGLMILDSWMAQYGVSL